MPQWAVYSVLDVGLPFHLLFHRQMLGATRRYFVERVGAKRGSFRQAYLTHRLFGQMMFDRFAVYGGKRDRFEVEVEGQEFFDRLVEGNDGFIVVGSHVGSMEMAGYLMHQERKQISSVVYGGESVVLQAQRMAVLAGNNITMIPVAADMSHLFAIKGALDCGGIVSMPADRLFGSAKSLEVDFLGGRAKFPIGAFMLAAQLDKRVVALYAMKEHKRGYKIWVCPIDVERLEKESSKAYAERLTRRYVELTEQIVRLYPRQWFNFYDFWD